MADATDESMQKCSEGITMQTTKIVHQRDNCFAVGYLFNLISFYLFLSFICMKEIKHDKRK